MTQQQVLGRCPHCSTSIAPRDVIIEYSRSGTTTQYAECPDCTEVVRPI